MIKLSSPQQHVIFSSAKVRVTEACYRFFVWLHPTEPCPNSIRPSVGHAHPPGPPFSVPRHEVGGQVLNSVLEQNLLHHPRLFLVLFSWFLWLNLAKSWLIFKNNNEPTFLGCPRAPICVLPINGSNARITKVRKINPAENGGKCGFPLPRPHNHRT